MSDEKAYDAENTKRPGDAGTSRGMATGGSS